MRSIFELTRQLIGMFILFQSVITLAEEPGHFLEFRSAANNPQTGYEKHVGSLTDELYCTISAEAQTGSVVPLALTRVTSAFGYRQNPVTGKPQKHIGLDIAAREGIEVKSIGPGAIIFAGKFGHYGNLVTVLHGKQITSLYGHLHEIRVRVGELILEGSIIGTVGSTGRVTGPHLHLEIRNAGVAINPTGLLAAINGKVLREEKFSG